MMTEQKRPRGRPRPQETIDRDAAVLALLTQVGPRTRNQIAESLGEGRSKVWLSLDRLRRDGKVQLCEQLGPVDALWAVAGAPCPG